MRHVTLAGGLAHGREYESDLKHLTLFAGTPSQDNSPAETYTIRQLNVLGRIIYVGVTDGTTDALVADAILKPSVIAGSVRA